MGLFDFLAGCSVGAVTVLVIYWGRYNRLERRVRRWAQRHGIDLDEEEAG